MYGAGPGLGAASFGEAMAPPSTPEEVAAGIIFTLGVLTRLPAEAQQGARETAARLREGLLALVPELGKSRDERVSDGKIPRA